LYGAVHVHAIQPDDESLLLIERLRQNCAIPIALSFENFDRGLLPTESLQSYFSIARFLVLPEVLARYRVTILVSDIDQLVVADLSALMRETEARDVALIQDPSNFDNVMNLFSASVLCVSWTERGSEFVAKVRDYLLGRIESLNGRLPWHLDQTALAYAQLTSSHLRWYAIPRTALQSDIGSCGDNSEIKSSTLFWSVTASIDQNRTKEAHPFFRSFLGVSDGFS
jgi:hypothetical protein